MVWTSCHRAAYFIEKAHWFRGINELKPQRYKGPLLAGPIPNSAFRITANICRLVGSGVKSGPCLASNNKFRLSLGHSREVSFCIQGFLVVTRLLGSVGFRGSR